MSEVFVGKADDFFYLNDSIGCLILFRNEENLNLKVGDKIKLITAEREIVKTLITGIPIICGRF